MRPRPLPSGDVNAVQPGNVSGNTYDKYASKNPVERKMMEGFFAALDRMLDGLDPRSSSRSAPARAASPNDSSSASQNATVVGLDLPDTDLVEEWDDIDVPMFFGDATRMPFLDDSIDLVVGLEVLEHVPEPERALADIARVCRGTALLSGPPRTDLAGRQHRPRPLLPRLGQHARATSTIGRRRAFERFVSTLDVTAIAHPLPWTMVPPPRRADCDVTGDAGR